MKKQKFHPLSIETPFLRKIKSGAQYSNQNHYIKFSNNSIEIRTFHQPPGDEFYPTGEIFGHILVLLRLLNLRYLTNLIISIEASFLFEKEILQRFALDLARHFKTLKRLDLRFLECSMPEGESSRPLLDSIAKSNKILTEIHLHFLGFTDLDSQSVKEITFFLLKRIKRSQRLKVVVTKDCCEIFDEKTCYFEPNTEKWLEELSCYHDACVSTGQTSVTKSGAAQLCSCIARYLKNLQYLALVFSYL